MKVLTQNVKCFPSMAQEKVEHEISAAYEEAGIIMWQEIELPRYQKAVVRLAPENLHVVRGGPTVGSMVSYNNNYWRLRDYTSELLHKAVPGVCADRFFTFALLQNVNTQRQLSVISCHFVPGAFSSLIRDQRRLDAWREGKINLIEFIEVHCQQSAVLVGGDFNTHRGFVLGEKINNRKVRQITPSHRADKLLLINGKNTRLQVVEQEEKPRQYTDHAGQWARLHLKAS